MMTFARKLLFVALMLGGFWCGTNKRYRSVLRTPLDLANANLERPERSFGRTSTRCNAEFFLLRLRRLRSRDRARKRS